jgi:hypothetical protein
MELSAYPRHRMRLSQWNRLGVTLSRSPNSSPHAPAGLAPVSVKLQNERGREVAESSFAELAEEILTGSRRQPKVPMIRPLPSSSQEYASKLNLLLKMGSTISDGTSSTTSKEGHRPHTFAAAPMTKYIAKRKGKRSCALQRPALRPTETKSCLGGHRVESYENGASVTKDELGRVVEVSSSDNQQMFITYSLSGFLKVFCLLDAFANVLLIGEQDEQGVVVKGPQGQIKVAGEYMSAGPNGCLTVHRLDGQFWTIDLVLNTFTERRFIVDRQEREHCLTAIFSDDGFRMMTRFQVLPSISKADLENSLSWQGSPSQVSLRFYGRDGSMVEFDSDESLQFLRPSLVLPGMQKAAPGPRNNRTAWDAVERYTDFAVFES